MRVSNAKAVENRLKVIDVASRLFRKHGFSGIGLNDLMKGAGLTQGGFYKRFESKEDLVALACERAMTRALERWSDATSEAPEPLLSALIDFYLSAEHRDDVEDGCPIVALGAEASRQGTNVKAVFDTGIRAHLKILASHIPSGNSESQRRKSMTVLATMVGALLLSRAVADPTLSSDFLALGAADVKRTVSI